MSISPTPIFYVGILKIPKRNSVSAQSRAIIIKGETGGLIISPADYRIENVLRVIYYFPVGGFFSAINSGGCWGVIGTHVPSRTVGDLLRCKSAPPQNFQLKRDKSKNLATPHANARELIFYISKYRLQ